MFLCVLAVCLSRDAGDGHGRAAAERQLAGGARAIGGETVDPVAVDRRPVVAVDGKGAVLSRGRGRRGRRPGDSVSVEGKGALDGQYGKTSDHKESD